MSYDYLIHGLPWKKHKYIAKVKTGGKNLYRYFYDQAEYQAFLHPEQSSTTTETKTEEKPKQTLSDWFKSVTSSASKTSSNVVSTVSKTTNNIASQVSKNVSDIVNSSKDTSLNNLKTPSSYVTNFVSNLVGGISVGQSVANTVAKVIYDATQNFPKSMSDLKKQTEKESSSESQEKINPNYNGSDYRYSNNCSYCTAAYDLRKRGYDVEAAPISVEWDDATTINELASWYDGTEVIQGMDIADEYGVEVTGDTYYQNFDVEAMCDAVEEELSQYGDGARGHFCLYWQGGGGHDIVWEVENGRVVFRDCQNNTELTNLDEYMIYTSDFAYFRTDNLEPNENVLSKVRNRK